MFKKKTIFNTDLPEGLSIIDEGGGIHVDPYDTYNSKLGYTGIGINSNNHQFVMGLLEDNRAIWMKNLIDVPGIVNTPTIVAANDVYSSHENTEAIILASPSDNNIAAKKCRGYEKGCLGKGLWDLPAGGHLRLIYNYRDSLIELQNLLYPEPLELGVWEAKCWTSMEYSSSYAYKFSLKDGSFENGLKRSNVLISIPIYVIK